ncbi:hypothetical protein RFI_36615, partial [Reticulomyxa filosa]
DGSMILTKLLPIMLCFLIQYVQIYLFVTLIITFNAESCFHHTLPYIISSNNFGYRCFVIKTRNKVSNKKKTEMILFCCNVGLSIEYDEQSKKKYLSIFMYMLMMLSYFLVDIILHLLQKCTDIQ